MAANTALAWFFDGDAQTELVRLPDRVTPVLVQIKVGMSKKAREESLESGAIDLFSFLTNVEECRPVSGRLRLALYRLTAIRTDKLTIPAYNRSMPFEWKDHIVSDSATLRGKPHLKGTRIPVSLVLGYLAAGSTPEQIMADFPDLAGDQITACLDYARDLAEFAVEA